MGLLIKILQHEYNYGGEGEKDYSKLYVSPDPCPYPS
jgi:hypothetical protein